jgi:arginase
MGARGVEIIAAPSNLGLRPPALGHEPGAWRAPAALLSAGLAARLTPARVVDLPRPPYEFEEQPGTRIRNGRTIREHALTLADAVDETLSASRSPVVLGGDCSIMLGSLLGARRGGRCGLAHVDGHCDFFHPGNYDTASRLGSAAGMDLALATGRGELLLTRWPTIGLPLVPDEDVIQMGDREAEARTGDVAVGDLLDPSISQVTVQEILRTGVGLACERAVMHLDRRDLDRVWLHLDLDVLDQAIMPAVDSPGSPGLTFEQLTDLLSRLVASGRVIGVDVTIYDPELDPDGQYLPGIVECLGAGLKALRSSLLPLAGDEGASR